MLRKRGHRRPVVGVLERRTDLTPRLRQAVLADVDSADMEELEAAASILKKR
jgi:hypothetical protein